MSRRHTKGYCPPPKLKMPKANKLILPSPASAQIVEAMQQSISEKMHMEMSHTATILTYMMQYSSVSLDVLNDTLDGDNCDFSVKLRNKARVAMIACNDFIVTFEPLINPDSKQEWNDGYGQFQMAMDNYFKPEKAYDKHSDAERAREISRAAALRYHDPLEKNPQRNFEEGFRLGAAYADLHPIGTVTITQNGVSKDVSLKELIDYYTDKHKGEITIEMKGKKK